MRLLYSPQRSNEYIQYEFGTDTVKVVFTDKYKNVHVDNFDFSALPDGEIARDEFGSLLIETTLPILPIVGGRRKSDGVLEIELLYFHSSNATETERFPNWQVVS